MHKDRINYFADVLMGISFIIAAISGILKFWVIPWNSTMESFFGISKPLLAMLHDWSGIVMVVMVFIHLALHYQWIITETKNLFDKTQI